MRPSDARPHKHPPAPPLTPPRLGRRAVLAGLGATLAAPARAGRTRITLRLHHFLPPMAPMQTAVFEPWAAALAEASEGGLDLQIFPAMQLGGRPPQLADQARSGIADLVWAMPAYTPRRFPVAETMGLPFMVTSAEQTSVALHRLMTEFGGQDFAGTRPLAFWVHAGGKLHLRDAPVAGAADLRGLKLRSPSASMGDLLARLGAEPVFFPVTEMVTGLSTGVIDGCCLPYEVVPAFRLQELTRFSSEPEPGGRGLYGNSNVLLMNARRHDSLPAELRAVLDGLSGPDLSRRIGASFDRFETAGRQVVLAQGNTITPLPAAELARWREAALPVHADWIRVLEEAGLDGAAILSRAEALLAAGV
ncbi:TRAP transporter substrate-binding protein [Salipiger marinus]|uniref:TRAP-type C4-dicarboxylate transport system, substrate-binding protein n=1 Tax=Salipiger marinus TaxID=555512 RepID=A0A1G8PHL5_9RHOB|nr:TRAP transporter substrate-binding protein [Salipiger marinus]SDI92014.1 TRAP-type C4-dicarboxylate transport system, substrate-binding protein [Salipiger marinus]